MLDFNKEKHMAKARCLLAITQVVAVPQVRVIARDIREDTLSNVSSNRSGMNLFWLP